MVVFGSLQIIGESKSVDIAQLPVEELSSLFSQQIECENRNNTSAELPQTITVPVSASVLSGVRSQNLRADALCNIVQNQVANVCHYLRSEFCSLAGSRVIDYYLYTLCCLRL